LHHANEHVPMRLLAFCLMPNHFHLALWPRDDGQLSDYMAWLLTAHVRRYHNHYHSSGHIWQGRFKSFFFSKSLSDKELVGAGGELHPPVKNEIGRTDTYFSRAVRVYAPVISSRLVTIM
jgi:REP element-mobilizing transposase RayT